MRQTLLIVLSFIITTVCAQTNLVENPSFKQTEKKAVKETKQIAYASPWTSPTLESADLYVTKTKSGMVGVPENQYGEEKPMMGDSYAGIMAYSYKSKFPRTYLQGKLTEKLEAGKEYCVTFHVSLADLSKYAVNHLAIAFTDKELKENNSDILQFDNVIKSKRLTVYEQQYYWIPVCGKYKAKGDEEFVVIGNFTPEEKLSLTKVKRPKGFTKPQTYDAYYYIDNVSVVPSEEVDKCDCDVIPGMENAQTVERDFTSDKDVNTKTFKIINTDGTEAGLEGHDSASEASFSDKNINGITINFDPKSFDLSADEVKKLDMVVAYLKENIDEKIVTTGYIDPSESDVDKLDGKRVSSVYKYILSKGVAKERVEREMGGKDGANEKDKLKNMQVKIETIAGE